MILSQKRNFESGSYEEVYGDFIECEDCAETHEEWLEFATKMIIGRRKLN